MGKYTKLEQSKWVNKGVKRQVGMVRKAVSFTSVLAIVATCCAVFLRLSGGFNV